MSEFFSQYWPQLLAAATFAFCGFIYRVLSKRISKTANAQKCLYNGTQALLRNEIIKSYNEYSNRGHIPIYAIENVLSMYDAYHGLGGNGTITKLIEELKALPSSPQGD